MIDFLARGSAWLDAKLDASASRSVTLTPPPGSAAAPVTVPASPGRSEWDESLADGVVVQRQSRDYLISAARLGTVRPTRGWTVTDSIDGSVREIVGDGAAPWDWCDTAQTRIRIRTHTDARQS